MDPAAAVRRILALVAQGRPSDALEAAEDLKGWLSRGGATPHGWTAGETIAFLTLVSGWIAEYGNV